MICPLTKLECTDSTDATVHTEFAGQFAYMRCRQTGALFVVMPADVHQVLVKRLELLDALKTQAVHIREGIAQIGQGDDNARILVDTRAEYGVADEELGLD